jgi:colicin import membrane protein
VSAQAPSPQAAAPTEQPVPHPESANDKTLSDKITEDAIAARAAAKAESEANAAMAKKKEATEKADKPTKGTAEAETSQVAGKSVKAGQAGSNAAKKSQQVAAKAEQAKAEATAKKAEQADTAAKGASAESAAAAATSPPPDPEAAQAAELKVRAGFAQDKFDLLDANHDGFVDRQEATKSNVLKTLFARFDVDKNGKLSLTEFAAINDLAAIKPNEQTAKRDLH